MDDGHAHDVGTDGAMDGGVGVEQGKRTKGTVGVSPTLFLWVFQQLTP